MKTDMKTDTKTNITTNDKANAKRSPGKKPALILGGVIALILLLSIGSLIFMKFYKKEGCYASLIQGGKVIKSIDLSKVQETYSFTVESLDGSYNIVEVRPGEIGIIEAGCPDKICVNMGFVHDAGLPITCLPNELIIIISDGEEMGLDTVVY